MKGSGTNIPQQARGAIRAVAFPAAVILILLAAVIGGVLQFSTSATDTIALARQNQRVRVAIEESVRRVRIDQEASTYWDDALVRTRHVPLDLEWIDNNLGVWFHTYYHIDEVYLLDSRDRPIYAMQDGRRVPLASFGHVAGPALSLADELRATLATKRLTSEQGGERTVGASAMAIVDGRPAFVSLKPFLSETGNIRQPRGSEYVHVAVRYLDRSFLSNLSEAYSIDGPRFSATPVTEASFPLRDAAGRTLGYISWTPFEPGKQVAERMIPVLSVALLIVGTMIILLLMRIHGSRRELEASRAEAEHLAFHDALTGLPNRALFEDRLKLALSRREARVAVLLLDLDRFKNVNDTLGHPAGDMLIRQFGQRLTSLTRPCDTIARLGGDEFAILVEGAALADVERLAGRILEVVKRAFDLAGAQAHVGASIGIATAGAGTDPLELVRKADIALYSAKEGGRNAYVLFNPEMDERVRLRGTIEEDLRRAVKTGSGLALHYQPQVNRDGAIVGVEALLRWNHPERGPIPPAEFVTIAEETGLMIPLGEWVLREACAASRLWPNLFVAVNLSPVQLRAPDFVGKLMRIVRQTRAEPARIQLEVTERVLLDDDELVGPILADLRNAGFKIVLDDFGTGYSSLAYLRRFHVDKIKIDGSFVQHLSDGPDSGIIVSAILALGWAMGLTVAAEGIETADHCTFLEAAGCKEMQGHYFSPAVPAEQVTPLLRDSRFSAAA
jgi:diguanylate cyclase (GGDEF)-like protein